MKRSLSVVAKVTVTALAIATALMLPVPAAYAIPVTFVGQLAGANEVPPIPSLGTGLATVVLDPTAQTIQVNATFSGLTSNDTAAHIHCCAPLGTNAGVATTVPAFPGFPLGETQGTYLAGVPFDVEIGRLASGLRRGRSLDTTGYVVRAMEAWHNGPSLEPDNVLNIMAHC